jgi:RND family efflux transporter MFP subunit
VAPIKGVIVDRVLNEGDLATLQVPLFEIANMDTVKVKIQIIERDLSKVRPGQMAKLTVSTYPDTFFQGRVIRVYPTLNPLTRTADAEIEIANQNRLLRPGMFATVNLIFQRKEQVTVIPKETIIEKTVLGTDTDLSTDKVIVEKHVFKVHGKRARWQTIETGIVNHTTVEVRSGLAPGDTIVTVGQHMLSDSSLINIINP